MIAANWKSGSCSPVFFVFGYKLQFTILFQFILCHSSQQKSFQGTLHKTSPVQFNPGQVSSSVAF